MPESAEGQADAATLLDVARRKTAEGRNLLAHTITDLFAERNLTLSDRERNLMFDILHLVIGDVEKEVRHRMAEHLADAPDTPKELIIQLANDTIDIAEPVLNRSRVLQDSDLIEVIRHRTLEHQLAIAIREEVSEHVSEALVDEGDEGVITTLLENDNSALSEQTMDYLVEQSARTDTFQEPILKRQELQPELARRMFFWVSAALRRYTLDNFDVDESVIDDLLEKISDEPEAGDDGEKGRSKTCDLVHEMLEEGMVTPAMMLATLREGEVPLFIEVFRTLLNIREKLARRIIFEPGGEGLAIACKHLRLSDQDFSELFKLTRKARASAEKITQRELRDAMSLYTRMTDKAADTVVRNWSRNAEYLAAVRSLEL